MRFWPLAFLLALAIAEAAYLARSSRETAEGAPMGLVLGFAACVLIRRLRRQ